MHCVRGECHCQLSICAFFALASEFHLIVVWKLFSTPLRPGTMAHPTHTRQDSHPLTPTAAASSPPGPLNCSSLMCDWIPGTQTGCSQLDAYARCVPAQDLEQSCPANCQPDGLNPIHSHGLHAIYPYAKNMQKNRNHKIRKKLKTFYLIYLWLWYFAKAPKYLPES